MKLLVVRLLVAILALSSLPIFATTIKKISVSEHQNQLDISIAGDQSFGYKYSTTKSPPRLLVDLLQVKVPQHLSPSHPKLKSFSISENHPYTRLTFTLDAPFSLVAKESGTTLILSLKQAKTSKPKNQNISKAPVVKSHISIVIDAGHGGKDPGAIVKKPDKTYLEKDITLAIAKVLKTTLQSTIKNAKVYLTRDDDEFLGLDERLSIAHSTGADLFLSLHCNSFKMKGEDPFGLSVFNLSLKESSEMAKLLSDLENKDLLEGRSPDDVIDRTILDITMKASMDMSRKFSEILLKNSPTAGIPVFSSKIERGKFVVLKSPDMASSLIELGFMTNDSELSHLSDPHYQRKLAKLIAHSAMEYFTIYAKDLALPTPN